MIDEHLLYSNKDWADPWGQNRGMQVIRRKNYLNNLIDYFKDKTFEKGLDLACGNGILSQEISSFVKDFTLADYSERVLNLAKGHTQNKFVYEFNTLPDIKINGKYDIIFLIEALYYLTDEEIKIFFSNVKGIMHHSSFLVITLEEDRLKRIKTDFIIRKSYIRYTPLISIGDLIFYLSRHINTKTNNIVNKYTINVCKYVAGASSRIYKSITLAKIELKIGKLIGIKHPRKLFILQMR